MTISFARHQFPPAIIRHAVWLYLRFTLSYRDVEDLLAERGLHVSYETVRRWVLKFGPLFARDAAKSEIGLSARHEQGLRRNNRAENSHQPHDDASARCSVSNRPDPPSASCPFTPPSKTPSTSSAISHPAARSASSETKRSGRGEPQPRPEPHLGLPIFARPNSVRVTGPAERLPARSDAPLRWPRGVGVCRDGARACGLFA